MLLIKNNPTELFAQGNNTISFDFYGDTIVIDNPFSESVEIPGRINAASIAAFYDRVNNRSSLQLLTRFLLTIKQRQKLDDWVYYQLIRKTAQQLSPKQDNYYGYTLYKWYLLYTSGYDCMLTLYKDTLMFYVKSYENIYNIPTRTQNGVQYVCLNYHDYGNNIDFTKSRFEEITITLPKKEKAFSYKVTHLPSFRPDNYLERDIRFSFKEHKYYFKVKLNPEIKSLFNNYPTVDYESYFNIPLSSQTYSSLIPVLKKILEKKNERQGVDFLMRFTRDAFLFETDSKIYGAEKRLSPEQTLLYEQSDCEDRAALFFYLVKEFYNLPMIVLVFPEHVTLAVALAKPVGNPILFNGTRYTICEPTPQKKDFKIGRTLPSLKDSPYEIGYVYIPGK